MSPEDITEYYGPDLSSVAAGQCGRVDGNSIAGSTTD